MKKNIVGIGLIPPQCGGNVAKSDKGGRLRGRAPSVKKVLSLFLSLVMVFTITAGIDFSSYATSKTQTDAVNWSNAQIGNALDYDGVYGAQCVDLIKYYYQFLGVSPVNGNGCDYATNSLPSGWQRIKYYSGFTPQPGDVAVWTYASSSYGHVAIITSGNASSFNVVEQNGSTHITRSHSYNYSYGTFYGVIRPNFTSNSSGSGAVGEMTTPNIHLDRNNYYVGDKINITWDATAPNNDFYQYWLVIDNKTNNQRYYGGSPGGAGDVTANHYDFTIPTSGSYLITVYAVPYSSNISQKVATKVINASTNQMTVPIISLDKVNYHSGNIAKISWLATSSDTDFYQYWLVIDNKTNGQRYYGGSPGGAGDVTANHYDFTIPTTGTYLITVYAVPYSNKNPQKVSTKNFTAYSEHKYNNGKITKTPTCTSTGTKTYTCSICGATKTETIPKTAHTYDNGKVTKEETCVSTGVKTYTCTKCGAVKTEIIPVSEYHGCTTKVVKPTCTKQGYTIYECVDCGVVFNDDYTKALGHKYTTKVVKPTYTSEGYTLHTCTRCKKSYKDKKTKKLVLKNTSISKITAGKKAFTIKWKKQSAATGYQIQYSTSSKFKGAKTVTISKNKTTSKKISKLKAKKKYYVRIRTYKTVKVNGKNTKVYSGWSKAKTVKTK